MKYNFHTIKLTDLKCSMSFDNAKHPFNYYPKQEFNIFITIKLTISPPPHPNSAEFFIVNAPKCPSDGFYFI